MFHGMILSVLVAERHARAMQQSRDMLNAHRDSLLGKAPAALPKQAKCPCCGSREFRMLELRRICAYCRSGQ